MTSPSTRPLHPLLSSTAQFKACTLPGSSSGTSTFLLRTCGWDTTHTGLVLTTCRLGLLFNLTRCVFVSSDRLQTAGRQEITSIHPCLLNGNSRVPRQGPPREMSWS